ncbi:MAG: cytochrome c [Candidatus Promineifilaceae bacterium]
MQTKVIIGTIAFMLSMIILGFATLLEPARLEKTTMAYEGRQVEKGATIFQANCSTCHGINGKIEQCFNAASGEPQPCVGLALNNPALLCGDPSPRMAAKSWSGSKRNFIYQTVSAGRPGTLMPTWSQEFGGSMEPYQIEQVVDFVLNWATDPALCNEPTPTPVTWPDDVTALPEGDAANGETLFMSTYPCTSCHGDPTVEGSNPVGPWLGTIADQGSTRIEGKSAAQYIYESVLHPNDFIAPVCANDQPCTEPSVMPMDFAQQMSQQDLADIIAYLLSFGSN